MNRFFYTLMLIIACSPYTLSAQSFTATQNINDANIDLQWSYDVSPCLLDPNDAPYPGNMAIQLLADGGQIFSQNINDLTPFLGPPQPVFDYVSYMTDSLGYYTFDFSSSPIIQTVNNYTVELWMRSESSTSYIFNDIFPNSNILLEEHQSIVFTEFGSEVGKVMFDSIRMNAWNHFAFAANGLGQTLIYVNGELKGTVNFKFPLTDFRSFGGTVGASYAEMRVWDRVRTANEINSNYLVNTFSPTLQDLIMQLKHINQADIIIADLAMVDGVSQQFTVDTSFINIIPYEATPDYAQLTGSFRHNVGPDQLINYEIKLFYNNFLIEPECGIQNATGQTLPYQHPSEITLSNDRVEKIILGWKNNSALTTSFTIKRDNEIIATINTGVEAGDTFLIEDIFAFNDVSSIVNGEAYTYTIETFSAQTNQTYPENAGMGSTIPIQFEATDIGSGLNNKIEINWSTGISSFADKFELRRNGNFVIFLDNDASSYTDFLPIFGETNAFEFVLWKNDQPLVADYDDGSVPPNGKIAGRVLTQVGNYPVAGVSVVATAENGSSSGSALTNSLGEFEIPDLTYGLVDSFTLEASLSGHAFVQVADSFITLTRNAPLAEDIIILDTKPYAPDNTTITIHSFNATPQNDKDQVFLDWSASASISNVFVEVKRDGQLVFAGQGNSSLNNLIFDNDGAPGANVKYQLRVFTINNDKVNEEVNEMMITFPSVAIVPALNVAANQTDGVINLNWSHTSTNHAGYNLYRNDNLIAQLDPLSHSFVDTNVIFDTDLTYTIGAYRSLENIDVEANSLTLGTPDPVNLGLFPTPQNATAVEQPGVPSVKIAWDAPTGVNLNYNFTGYRIYRGTELISVVYKDRVLEIEDREGFGFSGTYYISAFLLLADGRIEESAAIATNSVSYPPLPIPINLSVLQESGNDSYSILQLNFLSWFPSETNNYDGFKWYKNGQLIRTTPAFTTFVYDATPSSGSIDYSVRTFRDVGGQQYLSDPITQTVTVNSVDLPLPHPTNVIASIDLPNHVKICWEYPDFIPAQFIITGVNGGNQPIFKDTLPEGTLAYYDYMGNPDQPNLRYHIEAFIDTNFSKRVYTNGNVVNRRSIYGLVKDQNTGQGVPGVDVRVCWQSPDICPPLPPCTKIKIIQQQTKTDSTGFYYFDIDFESDFEEEVDMWVEATSPNSEIVADSIPFEETDDVTSLRIDFEDAYHYPYPTSASAGINNVLVTTDTMSLKMFVHFNTENEEYDLIEVSRGLEDFDDILINESKLLVDSLGAPGIMYNYTLRTINEQEDGREYSPYEIFEAKVPALEAVLNLTGTVLPDENAVWIQWSHQYNNASKYVILRNDAFLAEIQKDEPFQFIDQTGQPGTAYKYTLVAVLDRDGNAYTSKPSSVEVRFPSVSPPNDLSATVPFIQNVFLTNGLPLDTQYTLNHVELKWSYSDTNIQSFKIYRNGEYLAQVDKSTKKYNDFEFIPSSNVNYSVSVTKLVNGNLLESELAKVCPQEGICIDFPALAPPSNFNVQFRDSLADILFTLDYLPQGADGFHIYRSHTTDFENFDLEHDTIISFEHDPSVDSAAIEFLYKRSPVFWELYYAIQAYTVRGGVEYRSDIIPFSERIYQLAFPPPTNFMASDGELLNAVKLSWEYPKEIPLDTTFRLIRVVPGNSGNATEFRIDPGQRSFIDTVDFVPANGYWEYRLLSYHNGFNLIWESATDDGHPKLKTNQLDLSPIDAASNPSVSIDGEWMVVGDVEVDVKIYRFDSSEWKLFQVIPNSFSNQYYGASVDVSGDRMIIGSIEAEGSGEQGHVQILKFQNGTWNVTNTLSSGTESWGFATAIDGNRCVMTDPYEAFITIFDLSTGLQQVKFSQSAPSLIPAQLPGVSVDLSGDHLVVGVPAGVGLYPDGFGGFNGISSGFALAYEFTNDSISFVDTLLPSSGYFDNSFFGWDVAIDSHHIAMGQWASITQSYGAIEMFKRNQMGSYDFAQQINSPSPTSPTNDDFGWRVDIKDNLLVSTSPHYEGSADESQIHLFAYNGTLWNEIQTNRPDFSESDNPNRYPEFLGWDLHISDHHMALTNTETSIHVLDILPYFVSNVNATDDTDPFIEVTWSLDPGHTANISNFAVFRDNVHVANVAKTDSIFLDRTSNLLPGAPKAIAGSKHVYVIKPVLTNGFFSLYQGPDTKDVGSFIQNGKLSGVIYVNGTTIPVEGAEVSCSAMINEHLYSYSFVTGSNGAFNFDSLPYASDGTLYNLVPTYLDHNFELITPFAIPPLKPTDFTEESIIFYDTEAYTIYGDIRKLNAQCGLEDIKVVLCKTINGNTSRADSTYTSGGAYSFAVNPQEMGLEKLSLIIPDAQVFENGNDQDSIRFAFQTNDNSFFTDFANFDQFNEVNFTDTLSYPITIQVQNTCGAPISSNTFDIRIYTSDGCYDESFITNQSGFLNVNLPTNDYLIVLTDVNGAPTQDDLFAVEYLSTRPSSLNILSGHAESQLGPPPTFDIVKLTYHKAASFGSITNIFDRYLCDDFNEPAILTQGESYSIPISVSENHGNSCNVNEGFIIVRNAAADSAAVTQINFENGGFQNYTFKAGFPNLVAPHLFEIDFTYFSAAGDLLANMTQVVLVEGERSLPGSGVVVEPNQDADGQVKLPMIILRDPPGDQSYTKIETGASFTKSYSFDLTSQNDGGIYSEGAVGFGAGLLIGGFWNLDARWGKSTSDKTNLEFSLSNVESFSTSISEEAVGRTANVIVGAGFASQYGLTQRLQVADCDSITISNNLRFGLSNLATTWSYTVKFIEGIIADNIADSLLIEQGLKNYYYADGTPFSQEDARIKVAALIQSWKDILYYHDVESVPHYALCASNAFLDEILNEDARGQILTWRSNFCAEVGDYIGHQYVLDETVIWDNDLLVKYNNSIAAIEALKGLPTGLDLDPNTIFSQTHFTDPNYSVTSTYHNQLGTDNSKSAEIIDVSGQVLKEKTVTTQQSGSASYSYTGYNSIDLKAGAYTKFKGTVTIPVINQQITIAESEAKLGFSYSGSSSETTTRQNADANTSSMYYRILDGDADDQVSTVVLQGPMQNHSPYFIRLGGRSSCPAEEALTPGHDADPVSIDNPYIAVVNPNSGAVIASGEEGANHFAPPQYNVQTNELATFDLVIANNSSTTLTRDIEVFMPLQSNPNGAIVTLNGAAIGLTPVLLEDVPSTNAGGSALPFILRIERPAGDDYDFENIQIGVRPGCDGEEKFIYVSAYFQSPCSPVTLTSPINGFVVNRERVEDPNDRELIRFELRDYESANSNLDGIQLQFQRLGTGIGWEDVPFGFLTRTTLANSDAMIAIGGPKVYFFDWDITGQYDLYPDGDYVLRALAICNAGNDKPSNEVVGEIARTQILVGATEPADGIWSLGDEISITYSSNMDCGIISTPSFKDSNLILLDLETGLEVPYNIVCQNNKVIYQPIEPMIQYDGHRFKVTAKEMQNLQGNFAQYEEWTFRVSTQDIEWEDEMVEIYLYQGSIVEMKTRLLNLTNGSIGGLSILQSASSEPWLQVSPAGTFDLVTNDQLVSLQFIGTQPIGVYDDTIAVNGLTGRSPEIPVRMHILAAPPQIEVNSSYGDSMLLLINWRFDHDTELSKDTLDQIQAYVGNEVRGSGRILKSGQFYQAAFWVRGETLEDGIALDFEIWNSDDAGLYEGLHIPSDIKFTPDATLGTTSHPEVLIVESGPIIRNRIYVDSAQVNNPNTGFTWSTAFNKLEDALAIAMPLDTIWITGGTYYPTGTTGRNEAFDISNNLIIYGGFEFGQISPTQRTGNAETRLSGDIGIKANKSDNSYHVINATSDFLILDGITIENGNANGAGSNGSGGAMTNTGFTTLRNCQLHANASIDDGSIILNTGVEAKMILQDVHLMSEGTMAWIKNTSGAKMTVIGVGITAGE